MKALVFYVVQFTWGVLQNLAGLIGFAFLARKDRVSRHRGAFVCVVPNRRGSVSLGCFIFAHDNAEALVSHEYGHTLQSLLLGPLYFLVIGLPSLVWAGCFARYRQKRGVAYDAFYTERWATAWGR